MIVIIQSNDNEFFITQLNGVKASSISILCFVIMYILYIAAEDKKEWRTLARLRQCVPDAVTLMIDEADSIQ